MLLASLIEAYRRSQIVLMGQAVCNAPVNGQSRPRSGKLLRRQSMDYVRALLHAPEKARPVEMKWQV